MIASRFFSGLIYSGLALFGGLWIGYSMVQTAWSLGQDPYKNFDIFTEIFQLIETKHVDSPSSVELIHSAIDGMAEHLDEHSQYIPPERYKIIKKESDGWSIGVGIEVNKERTILRVIPSSPAAIAGLMVGDQLTHIDNQSIKKKSLHKIHNMLKGDRGTTVVLAFLRDGVERTEELIRDNILIEPVHVMDFGDGNIYIQLDRFTKNCIVDLQSKIAALYASKELRGVILDLRDNPGGFVEEGVQLVDLFIEEGVIIKVQGRNDEIIKTYSAEKSSQDILKAKLIILLNGNSASASELSAGVLQYYKRAKIIGTDSYGKGSMQKIYEFENGGALKLTIAYYLMPSGEGIDADNPLKPDTIISGHLEDPKKDLIETINKLNIDEKKKQLIIQRLSMLQNNKSSPSIPRSDDMEYRLQNDLQLKTAWNQLTNSSSSNE